MSPRTLPESPIVDSEEAQSVEATVGPSRVFTGESEAHRDLKRLALLWAHAQGYRIAAAEVSLPNYRVRMDVAAYQPQRVRGPSRNPQAPRGRQVWRPAIGATAIFECKVSSTDFIRDARPMQALLAKLKTLHERKARIEEELRIHYPSIRNGDSLFPEYETLNFERPGYERYLRVIEETRRLSARLHEQTKFDRLTKYGAANLFYLVAEPGIMLEHELPCGWGWLEREGDALIVRRRPHWHEVPEEDRLAFLQRIAMAATRVAARSL